MRAVWLMSLLACRPLPPPPGSESLGDYSFLVEPPEQSSCALPELQRPAFRFEGVVTREPATGAAWLTLGGGYVRDATWDGQVLDSVASERRIFPSCASCPSTVMSERMTFALLSRSQVEAAGERCPPELVRELEGGAGPVMTPDGFDALLACGVLTLSVSLAEGAAASETCPAMCQTCVQTSTLSGERR